MEFICYRLWNWLHENCSLSPTTAQYTRRLPRQDELKQDILKFFKVRYRKLMSHFERVVKQNHQNPIKPNEDKLLHSGLALHRPLIQDALMNGGLELKLPFIHHLCLHSSFHHYLFKWGMHFSYHYFSNGQPFRWLCRAYWNTEMFEVEK